MRLEDVRWTLGSVSGLHHRAFDAELLLRQLPTPPLTTDSLIAAARASGFRVKQYTSSLKELSSLTMPCIAFLRDAPPVPDATSNGPGDSMDDPAEARPALVVKFNESHVMFFRAGTGQGLTLTVEDFKDEFTGLVFQFAPPHCANVT